MRKWSILGKYSLARLAWRKYNYGARKLRSRTRRFVPDLRVRSLRYTTSFAYAICLRDTRRNSVFSEAAPTRVNAITRGRARLRRCLHVG